MIDKDLLPDVLLCDTSVLIRALGHKPTDPRSPLCQALFQTAIASNRRVLIAAPSIAEIDRGAPDDGAKPEPLPRTGRVVVVSFDQEAARLMGRKFPQSFLSTRQTPELSMTYLKYDALIVACAMRWHAKAVVTLDGGMKDRYGHLIDVVGPEKYQSKQPPLL